MNCLQLFLPCAAGVEIFLAHEVHRLTALDGQALLVGRSGVRLKTSWRDVLRLNLHSRLSQRVLVQLLEHPYRNEADLYALAFDITWEDWFTTRHSFKVEVTTQHSPLKSLNFAALRIKDAVVDRFRAKCGSRPDVNTQWPDVRIHLHLTHEQATLYIDTSGQPLFKRGWRQNKGDAPLKENLAAAMLAASGWQSALQDGLQEHIPPLYDPCCGSGTIAIEAAQIACGIAPGLRRRFAFEQLLPYQAYIWEELKQEAASAIRPSPVPIFGSDISHRMVDFARHNAERAGVAQWLQLRGGDALERMPPCEKPGLMLLNPPYGQRIATAGMAGHTARESVQTQSDVDDGGTEFFSRLATHWKRHYPNWQVWVLTPDTRLPTTMRLKASRRVPLWNGPIECRLLRFDMVAGSVRKPARTNTHSTEHKT